MYGAYRGRTTKLNSHCMECRRDQARRHYKATYGVSQHWNTVHMPVIHNVAVQNVEVLNELFKSLPNKGYAFHTTLKTEYTIEVSQNEFRIVNPDGSLYRSWSFYDLDLSKVQSEILTYLKPLHIRLEQSTFTMAEAKTLVYIY